MIVGGAYGNHFPAIVATAITEIELFISQQKHIYASDLSDHCRYDRWNTRWKVVSLIMITVIPELFFLSDRGDRGDHMETELNLSQ